MMLNGVLKGGAQGSTMNSQGTGLATGRRGTTGGANMPMALQSTKVPDISQGPSGIAAGECLVVCEGGVHRTAQYAVQEALQEGT